jgi:hypothetical protein
MITDRVTRTGDGSHLSLKKEDTSIPNANGQQSSNSVLHHIRTEDHGHIHAGPWGWGDADISKEDAEVTETLYPYLVDPSSKED